MFGELPKLFDRDFIIAFFLPAAIFLLTSFALVADFGLFPALTPLLKEDILKGSTILGIAAWLGGVFLMVMNYSIHRLLEGYGDYNPLGLLLPLKKRAYWKLQDKIDRIQEEIKTSRSIHDEDQLSKLGAKRDRLRIEEAERYPKKWHRLLPTAFGNAVRAFEDYPEQMYGVDAIVSWVRINVLVPDEFLQMLNAAKAQTDFWLNLWLLSFLLLFEYLLIAITALEIKMPWFPFVVAALIYLSAVKAASAAIQWGDFVKAAYDLYLPDLRDKLRLPPTADPDEEKELWNKVARQFIYHKAGNVIHRAPTLSQTAPQPKTNNLPAKEN
jgi:hypothetical protein